jgi:hypothetical protein
VISSRTSPLGDSKIQWSVFHVSTSFHFSLASNPFEFWLRDRNFLGVEAVIVKAVPASDWCSILVLGVFDFGWCFA